MTRLTHCRPLLHGGPSSPQKHWKTRFSHTISMPDPLSDTEALVDFVLNKGHGVTGLSRMNAINQIPDQFVQPPEERISHIQVATQNSVPTIDVSDWDSPGVADAICEAAAEWGFFQIVNHGIPFEVLDDVKKAAHDFFELPVEERRKYLKENTPTPTVTLKSSFGPESETVWEWKDYLFHLCDGRENEHSKLWPAVSRDRALAYLNRAKLVIRKLLEILLNGINVKQIDKVKESTLMGSLVLTLLYYPACPNPDLAAGAGRHSDVSSITILLQDDVGGLYVRSNDQWIHVAPIKGALVVNIGDVLQIMSNDRYKSIEHRVFVNGNKNRVSVPIFANPLNDAVVEPLREIVDSIPGEKPAYKPIVYSEYFNYFFSKGHNGKQTMDYVRI